MAETLTVPGVGPIKRQYVIAGGAVVAGIVGYAWWRRGMADAAPEAEAVAVDPDLIPETERTPVVGDSGGDYDVTDPERINTNAEWTRAATDFLVTAGWESKLITGALGKYLAMQGLTEQEKEIVLAARGVAGDPPVGGPYPMKDALPSTPPGAGSTAPGPVTNLRVNRNVKRNDVVFNFDGKDATSIHVVSKNGRTKGEIVEVLNVRANANTTYVWPHQWDQSVKATDLITYYVRPFGAVPGPTRTTSAKFRLK